MRGMILTLPVLAISALALSVPAGAQSMGNMPGMTMPGMKMPAKPAAKSKPKPATKATPETRAASPRSRASSKPAAHSGMSRVDMGSESAAKPQASHDMADMPGMDMGQSAAPASGKAQPTQGHDMHAMPGMDMSQGQAMPGMKMDPGMKMGPGGTTKPVVGNAPPPPVPTDHAADLIYGADAMRGSRSDLRTETGGQNFYQVMINLAEYQFHNGGDGYRWDGQAWFGGDVNRAFIKSEGEGSVRGGVGAAEIQALYSRAIGPYWNLQGGVRYDIRPSPSRTYATFGVEGLAPNNFDVNGFLFLSNKGDLLARAEGYYDQRITQRIILQPRIELNLAAQDVPENRIGAGLSNAELGLRLRYEIKREFAPYIGVSWDRRVGNTARYYRAAGENPSTLSFVLGVRTWF